MKNPMLTRNDSEYVVGMIDRVKDFKQDPNIIYLETFRFKKDAVKYLKQKNLKYSYKFDYYQSDKNSMHIYFISKRLLPLK